MNAPHKYKGQPSVDLAALLADRLGNDPAWSGSIKVSQVLTWLLFLLIAWGTTLPGQVASALYQQIIQTLTDFFHPLFGWADFLPDDRSGWGFDVMGHFFLFFLLSFCALYGYGRTHRLGARLAIVLLALTTELIQSWIPDRTVSPVDFMLDTTGLFLASFVLSLFGALSRPG